MVHPAATYCLVHAIAIPPIPDMAARGNLGVMASISKLYVDLICVHVVMSAVIDTANFS